jgi:hypothetical protein
LKNGSKPLEETPMRYVLMSLLLLASAGIMGARLTQWETARGHEHLYLVHDASDRGLSLYNETTTTTIAGSLSHFVNTPALDVMRRGMIVACAPVTITNFWTGRVRDKYGCRIVRHKKAKPGHARASMFT